MVKEFKKIFGDKVVCNKIEMKPKMALILAKRDMFQVEIYGIKFVLVKITAQEKFGVIALKTQKLLYEEQFRSSVAYCFETVSRSQRDALLKNNIPFVSFPEQVYLPFLGVSLSNRFKADKKVKVGKMMPATQALFLFLLYQKEEYVLKNTAAEALGLTKTSITRASEQLLAMDLIKQEKVGKEVRMSCNGNGAELWNKAKEFLISPVQKRIIVRETDIKKNVLNAGERALSYYSMLNEPKLKTVAIYKGEIDESALDAVDMRWEDMEELVEIELWKYNPFLFAREGKVDPISLACSMNGCEDERVEMAIDEMMEGIAW